MTLVGDFERKPDLFFHLISGISDWQDAEIDAVLDWVYQNFSGTEDEEVISEMTDILFSFFVV
jgi:hypothetical protein